MSRWIPGTAENSSLIGEEDEEFFLPPARRPVMMIRFKEGGEE